MIDYIQKGGMLMWPILICSIISIGVFAERLFLFPSRDHPCRASF